MNQKLDFLAGEGDKWYERNILQLDKEEHNDLVFLDKYLSNQNIKTFLEIGCSSGYKTLQLAKKLKASAYGIDPSKNAIANAKVMAKQNNTSNLNLSSLNFSVGTADDLEFKNSYFDFIYFGFCLYLVDRELLPTVIAEADRCLKSPNDNTNKVGEEGGFLAVLDFDPITPYANVYKHKAGLHSFKDDYSKYFTNKGYRIIAKESYDRNKVGLATSIDNRTSITLLQKQ